MVQGRTAEIHFPSQVVNAQRTVEVLVEPFNSLANPMGLAAGHGYFIQTITLRAAQQTVQNLAPNQRRQYRNVLGRIQQANQAQQGIEQ
ncbi:hypothetical protein D3C75_1252110 [compost metagenome]